MAVRDPRVDAYIARSAEFAQPILTRLREMVHAACPGVEETMKWSMPHFEYHGVLAGMAAFKQHCTFGFWKGALVIPEAVNRSGEAMGQFGCIRSLSDLPPKRVFARYVKRAAKLNEEGVPAAPRGRARRAAIPVPDDFAAALRRSRRAAKVFDEFPPSHRREYLEWITEAKRADTRARRIAQAVEWIGAGKGRNWKYE